MNRPAEAEPIVQLAVQRNGLFEHRHCVRVLLREEQGIAGPPEDPRDPGLVADLTKQRKRFSKHRHGLSDGCAADHPRKGRVVQCVGQRAVVSEGAGKRETFVVKTLGDRHVGLPVGQPARGLEGGQPFLREVAAIGHGEHVIHAAAALMEVTPHLPEPPHAGREFHRAARVF